MLRRIALSGSCAALLLFAAAPAHATDVEQGAIYLLTEPGLLVSGGPFAGTIFDPTPMPNGANAVFVRPNDITIGGTGALQLVNFAAHSRTPIQIGLSFFDVFVDLDPANLANDIGTLTVTGDATGGGFTEQLTYFARVQTVNTGDSSAGPTSVIQITSTMSTPGTWTPTPPDGAVIVTGPDPDFGVDDPLVNLRTGLDEGEVNFFPSAPFQATGTGTGGGSVVSTFDVGVIPDPAGIGLLGLALLGLTAARRRRAF
jgi:hypothetical protein